MFVDNTTKSIQLKVHNLCKQVVQFLTIVFYVLSSEHVVQFNV